MPLHKSEPPSTFASKSDDETSNQEDVPVGLPLEPGHARNRMSFDEEASVGSDWTLDEDNDLERFEALESDKLLDVCFVGSRGRSAGEDGLGPMAKPRKCRDVVFLLLFLLLWIGWIVVAWVVMTDGCPDHCNDPRRLVFGTDSVTREICGTGNQTGKLRLYFANPVDPLGRRFCLESCPSVLDAGGVYSMAHGLYDGDSRTIDIGGDHHPGDNCFLPDSSLVTQGGKKGCFYPAYETIDMLYKCVPVVPKNITEAAAVGLPQSVSGFKVAASFIASPVGFLGNAASELEITWPVIVCLCLLAVALGFVWLLLLRGFAMFLVMGTIFLLALGLIGITLLAWDKAGMLKLAKYYNELAVRLNAIELSPPAAEAVAVIITLATVCFLLLVCCMYRRIRMAVRLIQESAKAVHEMPSTILFPLSTLLFVIILGVWSVFVGIYIASAGDYDPVLGAYSYASHFAHSSSQKVNCANDLVARNPMWLEVNGKNSSYIMGRSEAERLCVVYDGNVTMAVYGWELSAEERVRAQGLESVSELDGGARDVSVKDWLSGGFRESLPFDVRNYYRYFWVYHAFAFAWTYTFLLSCLFMCLAGAVGHWYWREEGEPIVGLPVWRAFLRLLSYQLGTAAFGALVVSLVWIARMSFHMTAKQLKTLKKRMPPAGAMLCMVKCCLGLVETVLKFINRNALIVAAIHGESYCWSAAKAFSLLMANVLRVASVSVASTSLIVMGKLFITASCVLVAWAYFTNHSGQHPNLHGTPVTTLIVVGLSSWLIARLFLNVYIVVIDAVLLSFFEDCTSERPVAATRHIDGFVKKEELFDKDRDEEREGRRRTSWRKKKNKEERRKNNQSRKV